MATPRTPRKAGTSTKEPSPGIKALRERRAARQAAREEFYGKNPTATERRQARNRGESPKPKPKPVVAKSGGKSGPTTQVVAPKGGKSAFKNPVIGASFTAYKAAGGPLGPSTWYQKLWRTGKAKKVPPTGASPVTGTMAPVAYKGKPPAGIPADHWAAAKKAGAAHGVDPKLLAAIAAHETGFGTLGQGRRGLTLGVGAYDSGAVDTWAGQDRQYQKAGELLSKWGANSIADVMAGRAASYATDPGWESKVQNWYNRL